MTCLFTLVENRTKGARPVAGMIGLQGIDIAIQEHGQCDRADEPR